MNGSPFTIAGTDRTPAVSYKDGDLLIEGKSLPDAIGADAWKIIHSTVQKKKPNTLSLKFTSFNSPAAREIMDLLMVDTSGISPLTINWIYEEGNIDMKAAGKDYEGEIRSLPDRDEVTFNIIQAEKIAA